MYNYNFLVYASNDQATLDKIMLSTNITKVGYCGIDDSLYAKQQAVTQITFKGMFFFLSFFCGNCELSAELYENFDLVIGGFNHIYNQKIA